MGGCAFVSCPEYCGPQYSPPLSSLRHACLQGVYCLRERGGLLRTTAPTQSGSQTGPAILTGVREREKKLCVIQPVGEFGWGCADGVNL